MSKFTDNLTMCDSEALLRSADRIMNNQIIVGAGLGINFVGKPITLIQNPPLPMSKFTDNLTMCDSEALLRSADRIMNNQIIAHIPHPQLAHTRIEGVKVNHPRQ